MAILNNKLLKSVGLKLEDIAKTKTIKEYLQKTPPMVFIKCVNKKVNSINLNNHKVEIKKDEIYAVPLNMYLDVKKDSKTKELLFKPHRAEFIKSYRRYSGQDLTDKKLLVWRTGGFGDLLFIQPILRFIKDKYPTCSITFATSPQYKTIFSSWPVGIVDYLTTIPLAKKVIDFNDYHLCFTNVMEVCDEAKILNVYDLFKKVSNLDFEYDSYPLVIESNENLDKYYEKIVTDNTILIQPTASTPLRSISKDKWSEIIKLLNEKGFKVGILDSKNNHKTWDWFIKKYNFNSKDVVNYSHFTPDINGSISLIKLSKGVICLDSAISHITAGLRKPCVALYGPFSPNNYSSYYPKDTFISMTIDENWNECGMRYCRLHAQEAAKCPYIKNKKFPGCLEEIDNSIIVDNLISLMETKNE